MAYNLADNSNCDRTQKFRTTFLPKNENLSLSLIRKHYYIKAVNTCARNFIHFISTPKSLLKKTANYITKRKEKVFTNQKCIFKMVTEETKHTTLIFILQNN